MKYYMDITWCRCENCKYYRFCENSQIYAMKKQGKEDYQIKIQYRDDGGDYSGEDDEVRCFFDDENKVVIV